MTPVELSEVVRNYALVAAGFGGGAIAIWRAIAADRQSRAQRDQVMQSRREHATELFSRAVGTLDSETLHIRLGAIYTLRDIMDVYSVEQGLAARDLLTQYLADMNYADGEPPADVRAIVAALLPPADRR
ncbi:MAG: hypothetical protein U1E40_10140 [Amaricoccus sp.]